MVFIRELYQYLIGEPDHKVLGSFKIDYSQITRLGDEIYQNVVEESKSTSKWVSEQSLFRIVKSFFSDAVYQFKAEWLGAQSLDIYIPSIKLGIEYQGIQHYKAIDIFGGERGLKDVKSRDKRKRRLCQEHGVTLFEWKYEYCITEDEVIERLGEWINKTQDETRRN